jgi:uncharacterized membrane protein YecN with MAPEG domain
MAITAFYASLLAFLFIFLSARVIAWRRAQKVEIGDGQDRELLRRIRVHANFVEYTPMFIVLLGLAEQLAAPRAVLHLLGAGFLLGRLIHAYALSQTPHVLPLRVAGMVMSLATIIAAALNCLVLAVAKGLS